MYRTRMVRDYIRPFAGCRILDVGCGTGEYIEFLDRHCPSYEYFGFDAEGQYIAYGKQLLSNRTDIHFYHHMLTHDEVDEFNDFDIVLAIGVMHHMDDDMVLSLLRLAKKALKAAGRLITYDPGRFDDMNIIEKFFVNHDRGRSIRSPAHYCSLISQVFLTHEVYLPCLTYYPCRNVVFDCINE